MNYQTILVDISNNIATITLNAPSKLNSISSEMIREIESALDEIEQGGEGRVVIFTGAGKVFCAGADLEDLQKTIAKKAADKESSLKAWFNLVRRIKDVELPTIACVNGVALGGGLALALAADIRYASEDARAGSVFVLRGASSADMGVSWMLPRIVGAGIAAELMFTGDIIDAVKCERIGLYNKIVPRDQLQEATMELAKKLAANPPLGLKITKRAFNRSIWDGVHSHLDFESASQTFIFFTDDFNEGVTSFYEKRKPVFRGR